MVVEILEGVDVPPGAPESALKAIREAAGKHQLTLANETGVSQGFISELESGRKPLTSATAAKLAPGLGVAPEELEAAETITSLHRAALKSEVDPRQLLEATIDLSYSLPDNRVSDALIDALLSVLKHALETFEEERGVAGVSTKSRDDRPRRDRQGRRPGKPHGFDPGSYEAPRRDASGRRVNKPNDPNSPRNRRGA